MIAILVGVRRHGQCRECAGYGWVEVVDEEESDWEVLGPDFSDYIKRLDPVEPSPAYQGE